MGPSRGHNSRDILASSVELLQPHGKRKNSLNLEDMATVWEGVSELVYESLISQKKPMYINNFGTFTFLSNNNNGVNSGNSTPVPFLAMESNFLSTTGTRNRRSGKPISNSSSRLNLLSLSNICRMPKLTCKRIVEAIVHSIHSAVSVQPWVELTFPGLGVFQCKNKKCEFLFKLTNEREEEEPIPECYLDDRSEYSSQNCARKERIYEDDSEEGKSVDLDESFEENVESLKKELSVSTKYKRTFMPPSVDRLKEKLKKRGGINGINSIARVLRIMDDSGDGKLSKKEFKFGLHDYGVKINAAEIDEIFRYFDSDNSGSISLDEFLVGIRGPLNERRIRLIGLAFKCLDRNKDGFVTVEDLEVSYDTSKHPEVISGKKSRAEVLRGFLEQFDTDEKDGIVTEDEFIGYYKNVSASIDDDNYFELMIRNAWHISGGKGQYQNTSNRRVLVTQRDGIQTVEEIKDDLWLDTKDEDFLKRRIKERNDVEAIGKLGFSHTSEMTNKQKKLEQKTVLKKNFKTSKRNQDNYIGLESTFSSNIGDESIPSTSIGKEQKAGEERKDPMEKLQVAFRRSKGSADEFLYNIGANRVFGDARIEVGNFIRGLINYDKNISREEAENISRLIDTDGNGWIDVVELCAQLKGSSALARVKAAIKEKTELHGLSTIIRILKRIDTSGDKALDRREFRDGFRAFGLTLTSQDIEVLFAYFDKDKNGKISTDEFFVGLCGSLNDRRRKFVEIAFNRMDRDGSGDITVEDIENIYDTTHHPEVRSGKKSHKQALKEVLEQFDQGEKDGIITKDEFMEYYRCLSASIENDDYFELMMRNAWHISGGKGQSQNTTNRRVLVTHNDGKQTVEEIEDDLWIDKDDEEKMKKILKNRGINAVGNLGKHYSNEESSKSKSRFRVESGNTNFPRTLGKQSVDGDMRTIRDSKNAWGAISNTKRSLRKQFNNTIENRFRQGAYIGDEQLPESPQSTRTSSSRRLKTNKNTPSRRNPPPIVERMRKKILTRGGSNGIQTLSRVLRIMDDSGDKCLDRYELKNGLRDYGVEFGEEEINDMFDYLDKDRSGKVSFDEFLVGLRGPISKRRKDLILLAFSRLDRNNDGFVTIEDLEMTYDPSHSPEVKSGKLTKVEGLREFLSQFDTIEKDGIVTQEEFVEYYKNVSASIDTDDYFELMMRNAWHISGGKGQCANTTNRRVLVTHQDGNQTVEELQDDLWLDSNNEDEMRHRLEKRGIKPVGRLGRNYIGETNSARTKNANNSTISLAWEERKSKNKASHEKTRRIRNGAAKQIQSIARARKSQLYTSNLRRQQKAKTQLQIEIEKENERMKSKIYRPKGKNWY